ncbi:MAG TPA: lipoate--protein ligase family protein [Pirellulaceae bacterium]|nr:lipoate--protein ligase family protein [Pirellulaceae bacterium]
MTETQFLSLTLPDLDANLALDEALLDAVAGETFPNLLRLWEPPTHFVVIGRGSKLNQEVDVDACRQLSIPVMRRCSGGAAIVAGPGCLMYSVVFNASRQTRWRDVQWAHDEVMSRHLSALQTLGIDARWEGTCDLTVRGRKISGNSLRCVRNAVLYHGTFLYDFDLSLIERCLWMPPRVPAYRKLRSHGDFVGQLPVTRIELEQALRETWQALDETATWPREQTERLVQSKYRQHVWNAHGQSRL